ESAIMVGDRSYDILGAAANNVVAVGVLWGYGSKAELIQAGAQAILAKPNELSCISALPILSSK
ncbi:MAG: HAD hydrolase-like protein, partial [Phormidesmis sp.]